MKTLVAFILALTVNCHSAFAAENTELVRVVRILLTGDTAATLIAQKASKFVSYNFGTNPDTQKAGITLNFIAGSGPSSVPVSITRDEPGVTEAKALPRPRLATPDMQKIVSNILSTPELVVTLQNEKTQTLVNHSYGTCGQHGLNAIFFTFVQNAGEAPKTVSTTLEYRALANGATFYSAHSEY